MLLPVIHCALDRQTVQDTAAAHLASAQELLSEKRAQRTRRSRLRSLGRVRLLDKWDSAWQRRKDYIRAHAGHQRRAARRLRRAGIAAQFRRVPLSGHNEEMFERFEVVWNWHHDAVDHLMRFACVCSKTTRQQQTRYTLLDQQARSASASASLQAHMLRDVLG